MSEIRTLSPWLERFLTEHIVTERNLARNTQKSYRDTFALLLPFLSSKLRKSVDRLAVRDLTSKRVLQFLTYLEENRGCSVQTRNQRLTALRAFARFVGSRDPAYVGWCGHIRAISSKKAMPQPIGWLTKTEMDAVLDVPDRKTPRGRNEYALLLFLYNTGARVSETTGLRVRDLQVGHRHGGHALVTLHGKGGKIRQCPLWTETDRELAMIVDGRAANDAVFLSRYGRPFTRFGIYRLVERCAARVPALVGNYLSFALNLSKQTRPLHGGHASLNTTNIYAEIDLEMKAKALALCDAAEPETRRAWKEKKGLMAFLKSL